MRLAAVFVAALTLGAPAVAQEAAPFPGHAAPSFSARLADGTTVTLADLQRSAPTLVLHFWGIT
jgi:hypothetical protein